MADYVEVQGKVLSSGIKTEQIVSHNSTITDARLKEMYSPDVEYQYVVDGKTYQNSRFWQERVQISQVEKIEKLIAQYPVGVNITVYYNPTNPGDSYLETLPEINFRRYIIWGIFILIGIVILIFVFIALSGG